MTRYDCRRCDWRPAGDGQRVQLADHATEAGHPLCVVCGLSLDRGELQTCRMCVGQARRDLHRITDLYAILPAELGHAKASPMDPTGAPHGDENPIPGGQILPLLAGGSRGLTQITGAPTRQGGRDHTHDSDERDTDPQSVAFELSRWEDHWRHLRHEPAAATLPTVTGCSAYLFRNIQWAADTDDEFQGFTDDLSTVLYRLERATGHDEPRSEGGAPCFECGADLRREWTTTGLAEEWKCPRCHATYSEQRYWLAVREDYEAEQKRRKEAAKTARREPA